MVFLSEFELMHVDEFIDELLHSERVCDIILPRLQVRDKGHTYTVHNNVCKGFFIHVHYKTPWISKFFFN